MVESYRKTPLKQILEYEVTKTRDFSEGGYIDEDNVDLPKQNFIQLTLENGFSIAIRPSGTEPKIKYYLFGCGERNPTKIRGIQKRGYHYIKCNR